MSPSINGFQPVLGNTFQPLTFASSSGNFGFYNGIVLGNRLILDPALNPTNLTLTVQPAVTTTTLAAPPSPSVSGQSVTFTATVTVALPPTTIDPVPTGTVTFYDNGTAIGTGTLSVVNGQDQASLTIATLSTASHSITAAYTSGDANFIPSPTSTAVTQVVNKANTSATVASSVSPSVLRPGGDVHRHGERRQPGQHGRRQPHRHGHLLRQRHRDRHRHAERRQRPGPATFTTSSLSTATHPITAAYTSGDGNFNASPVSASISQVVNKDNTTTAAERIAGRRERRAGRDLHGHGHRQCAGLGHADRDRRLLRHHDQHRPDARRGGTLIRHGQLRDDEPGGRLPHDQGHLLGRHQLPDQQRHRRHGHHRPDDLRPRPVGRRGPEPLRQREHQHRAAASTSTPARRAPCRPAATPR